MFIFSYCHFTRLRSHFKRVLKRQNDNCSMKTIVETLVGNVVCHAQQTCLNERRTIDALEELDDAEAPFSVWLAMFMSLEAKKRAVISLAERVCQPEKTIAYFENAQEVIAEKLVMARKDKHQALLFAFLRRHSAIVRRVYATLRLRGRRKTYRVVGEDPSGVVVLQA